MLTAMCITCGSQQHFDCPLAPHLSPCTCTEATRGLDITCTDISSMQLGEVIDVLGLTRQTLWFLRLTRAELFHFPRRFLKGLDVRNLIAVQSNISTMDHDVFEGEPSRMESLDMGKNSLGRVPTRTLSPLKELAALNLEYNSIEVLESHAFDGLLSLLWLSLYGNFIQVIDGRAFAGTEASLTRLNLGGNRLSEVPSSPLKGLKCLQGLRLHNNNISDVVTLVEDLPPSLCELDLSGNIISDVVTDSFSTLPHLSSLDLEGNRIQNIEPGAFEGIQDSLEWLKLGGNEISRIPSSAFRNLSRLRQLDLRCNLVSEVEEDAFADFGRTLKFIFLQKNSIQTIAKGALDILESVEWLYLQSNELTSLPIETFQPVISKLQVLDLHDNPFHCDCDMLWFRNWLQGQGANVANLPKETRCRTPEKHNQKPIVKLPNNSFVCSSPSDHVTSCFTLVFLLLMISLLID